MARWIELLGSSESGDREAARAALHLAGAKAVPQLLAGSANPFWRIRRGCLRVLDHQPLTVEIAERLVVMLQDSHRKVRDAALHTLACEGCKPEGCELELPDIVAYVIDAALNDPSSTVRRHAVGFLLRAMNQERVQQTIERVFAEEGNPRVLRIARFVLPLEERRTFLRDLLAQQNERAAV